MNKRDDVTRAETVGSLLRDEAVVRAARRSSPADSALLDDAARDAIRLQEDIGLDVITDGEVRRTAWAQTTKFLDCFAPTVGRGALNWRGATDGPSGAPNTGRAGGLPGGRQAGRDRAARRRHDRRVRVPRPLRARQDQVHDARAELPPALLVRGPVTQGLRLLRGVPDRDPRLPARGRGQAGVPGLRLHPARRAELRVALRPGHPRRDERPRAATPTRTWRSTPSSTTPSSRGLPA